MRLKSVIIKACLLCFFINSCSTNEELEIINPDNSNLSNSDEHNLHAVESSFWPSNLIEVCWENPSSDNAIRREWVKDQIEKTWAKYSNVTFWNWGTCTSGNQGIRIFITENSITQASRVKALGANLDGFVNGMELDFDRGQSNITDEEISVRAAAVHEFGHALGFTHEHNVALCNVCGDEPNGPTGDLLITPCDIDSVMNYCNPDHNGDGELSDFDIEGVQSIYGIQNTPALTFYDKSGLARVYKVNPSGTIDGEPLREYTNFRTNWDIITTYKIDDSNFTLFYDQTAGLAQIYSINTDGSLGNQIKQYDSFRTSWSKIVPYKTGNSHNLLFYDQTAGLALIYNLQTNGDLNRQVKRYDSFRTSWSEIIPYESGGSNYLLFYDKSGVALIYNLQTNGDLNSQVKRYDSFRTTWSKIVPYKSGNSYKLLFYDQTAGHALIYSLQTNGDLNRQVKRYDSFRTTWSKIVPFQSENSDYLLFYDPSGTGSIYNLQPDGDLNKQVIQYNSFRTSWSEIYSTNNN